MFGRLELLFSDGGVACVTSLIKVHDICPEFQGVPPCVRVQVIVLYLQLFVIEIPQAIGLAVLTSSSLTALPIPSLWFPFLNVSTRKLE